MFVSFYCLELWITLALCCHLVHSEEYIYISVLDSCGSDFIAAACVYGNYQAWKLLWGFCALGHWFFRTCAGLSGVMLLEAAKLPVWLGSWWFGMFYFYGLSKQSKRKSWTCVECLDVLKLLNVSFSQIQRRALTKPNCTGRHCTVSATPAVLKYQCSKLLHSAIQFEWFFAVPKRQES